MYAHFILRRVLPATPDQRVGLTLHDSVATLRHAHHNSQGVLMKSVFRFGVFSLVLTFVLFGCGKKEEQTQEQSKGVLEQLSDASKEMQKAAEEMAGQGDREPVPPVSFKVLIEFLPKSIGGLTADKPEGESASMGEWSYSQAECNYNSDDGNQRASVQIFDYAYISMLYAPFKMMLSMKIQKESSRGYEKSISVAGYPAFEKWDTDSKHSEVTIMVGDRFIVTVNSYGFGEGSSVKIAESMDLKKLAAQHAA